MKRNQLRLVNSENGLFIDYLQGIILDFIHNLLKQTIITKTEVNMHLKK